VSLLVSRDRLSLESDIVLSVGSLGGAGLGKIDGGFTLRSNWREYVAAIIERLIRENGPHREIQSKPETFGSPV